MTDTEAIALYVAAGNPWSQGPESNRRSVCYEQTALPLGYPAFWRTPQDLNLKPIG
jgi:hypothetical protein